MSTTSAKLTRAQTLEAIVRFQRCIAANLGQGFETRVSESTMKDQEGQVLWLVGARRRVSPPQELGYAEPPPRSEATLQLVQALRSHNAELERQNENLRLEQAALLNSSARYEALFLHAPFATFLLDRRGRLVDLNPEAAALLRAPRGLLVGRALAGWIGAPGGRAQRRRPREHLAVEIGARRRADLRREDGTIVRVLLLSSALLGASGQERHYVAVVPLPRRTLLDRRRARRVPRLFRPRPNGGVDTTADG